MSTLSLRLPASLHKTVRELSERDEVSINQFIATAVAEKASALLTVAYLEARGQRSSRTQFDRILARVPNTPPMAGDELPPPPRRTSKALAPTSRRARPQRTPRVKSARG